MKYMQSARTVYAGCIIVLLLAAATFAGCASRSPDIVTPGTPAPGIRTPDIGISMSSSPRVSDCFFRVNDSAHGAPTGSSQRITITGYVSSICYQSLDNLVIRGILYDSGGNAFASGDTYVGRVAFHERVPFSLTINTENTGLYTYQLHGFIRGQQAQF